MEPTISIPQGWQYPRYGFGGRTAVGQIIGMKYYAEDTFLANQYGEGWRYILLLDKHGEDEEHRIEDDIKLLSPQELKTNLEAEIQNYQRQIQSLKHQLQSIPGSTAEIEPVTTIQPQSAISPPALRKMVEGAKILIQEIAKHPDYLALDYQPDLTLVDAETALTYLESELEPQQDSD